MQQSFGRTAAVLTVFSQTSAFAGGVKLAWLASGQAQPTRASVICGPNSGRGVGPARAALVQTVALSTEQHEPVELWSQDAGIAQVSGRRQVEGDTVEW